MTGEQKTIKRSQAIHPYGPGAILDWGQECFVVLDTSRRGWDGAERVDLDRLSRKLGVAQGFRLPPLAGEFSSSGKALRVQRFPTWLFCPSCRRMVRWNRDKEVASTGAPRCEAQSCSKRKPILVPMRYLAACDHGHLSEPNWWRWAHSTVRGGTPPCPNRDALKFVAKNDKGSTLEALVVHCTACGAARSLASLLGPDALRRIGQRCSGRQPWQARDRAVECDRSLSVLQRSQTAVHFADIVSAIDLSVEKSETRSDVVKELCERAEHYKDMYDNAEEMVQELGDRLRRKVASKLSTEVSPQDLKEAVAWVYGGDGELAGGRSGADESELLDEEWPVLTTPSPSTSREAPLVIVREALPADAPPELQRLIDSVHRVERLRELRVFRGFRRLDPSTGEMVRADLDANPPLPWLPATEVFGEGIMVALSDAALREWRASESRLEELLEPLKARISDSARPASRFAEHVDRLDRFLVAHTFAHVLMRQLCYECGYSAASLRERLYVFEDRCGVLIYTADGDSEGSLGGLVRQGRSDRLPGTIQAAVRRAAWCSNDPICSEMPAHGFEGLCSAACHACAYAAETSCVHLNALLDRRLLVGDEEGGINGFMAALARA